MKRIAIMQPYFFPYIGYWQLMDSVDTFVIYDDVNYITRGYIARNAILLNGQAHRITLEQVGASQNRYINEIQVGANREKLLKTIEQAYRKAPFFEKVFPLLQVVMSSDEKNLARFLRYAFEQVMGYLNISTTLIYSSEIEKEDTLKGKDKIIALCKQLGATHYVNAIGGQELYDKAVFQSSGIVLNFLEPEIVEYQQFGPEFIPSLSIIDVMMFNSPQQISQMLKRYRLV